MRSVDIEVPNDLVDMDSRRSSACYPRGIFDPLSEIPSTRQSRISMTDFRPCSTRRSHSQASIWHSPRILGVQPSWAYLRTPPFICRRPPPQSNFLAYTVFRRMKNENLSRVVFQDCLFKSLTKRSHKLPPLLFKRDFHPIYAKSKDPRGLLVYVKVFRIFTETANSLSSRRRQQGDRYTIHAGHQ